MSGIWSMRTAAAMAVLLADEVEILLAKLGDPRLRQAAVLRLEGHSNTEIAVVQKCAEVTVERRFGMIRRVLKKS